MFLETCKPYTKSVYTKLVCLLDELTQRTYKFNIKARKKCQLKIVKCVSCCKLYYVLKWLKCVKPRVSIQIICIDLVIN